MFKTAGGEDSSWKLGPVTRTEKRIVAVVVERNSSPSRFPSRCVINDDDKYMRGSFRKCDESAIASIESRVGEQKKKRKRKKRKKKGKRIPWMETGSSWARVFPYRLSRENRSSAPWSPSPLRTASPLTTTAITATCSDESAYLASSRI